MNRRGGFGEVRRAMRVQIGFIMAGPGKIVGLITMIVVFRIFAMMAPIVGIECNHMNRMKIISFMGMRRRRRRHTVLRERNHKDRRQDRSQEPHSSILYGNR